MKKSGTENGSVEGGGVVDKGKAFNHLSGNAATKGRLMIRRFLMHV